MRRRSSATSSRRSVTDGLVLVCAVVAGGCSSPSARPAGASAPAALEKSTDHLTLSATLSALSIAADRPVVLTADITPRTGMHVYAPGSKYRAVGITLPEGSRFRLETPVDYPKPVLYTFTPLNETVPVYDAPFRLAVQIGLDPAPRVTTPQQPASLPLNASLDYQACDDRVCYLPESVPLRWTVTLPRTPAP